MDAVEKIPVLPGSTASKTGPTSKPAPAFGQNRNFAGDGVNEAQIRQAAEDFEAVFISQMLAPIFEGLETDGPFGGGSGERVYRSLLVEEYGKAIAKSGGIGISDAVQREILKLQEV